MADSKQKVGKQDDKTPFTEIMRRLERVQRQVEDGTMETGIANSIASSARTWLSGINTAMKVAKASSSEGKALMDGTAK